MKDMQKSAATNSPIATCNQIGYDWFYKIVVLVLIIVILNVFVFNIYLVQGSSMEPNYHTGEAELAYKLVKEYKRGDVVFLYDKGGREIYLIKRVVGLPGETVFFENGKVYIDGKELKEDYILEKDSTYAIDGDTYVIGEDEYFVLGDNRENSYDSRYIGPVNKKLIEGKVVFK